MSSTDVTERCVSIHSTSSNLHHIYFEPASVPLAVLSLRAGSREVALARKYRKTLREHGWKVFNLEEKVFGSPGIPDLVALRDGHHVWIEFKAVPKPFISLSSAQEAQIESLVRGGAEVRLVNGYAGEVKEYVAGFR